MNSEFCRIINVKDPFKEEKANSNHIALELYKKWKPKVLSSLNPFDLALRLAIAGNIMDYGANNSFDIHETIKAVLKTSFAIDYSTLLKNNIGKAKRILFLGDNAGELVMGDLSILIKNGLSRKRAFWYKVLSVSPALLFEFLAYFLSGSLKAIVPYVLDFSAASFLYLPMAQLIPEMHRKTALTDSLSQIILILLGISIIYVSLHLK